MLFADTCIGRGAPIFGAFARKLQFWRKLRGGGPTFRPRGELSAKWNGENLKAPAPLSAPWHHFWGPPLATFGRPDLGAFFTFLAPGRAPPPGLGTSIIGQIRGRHFPGPAASSILPVRGGPPLRCHLMQSGSLVASRWPLCREALLPRILFHRAL